MSNDIRAHALRVEEARFTSVDDLAERQAALDGRGLRATASPAHEAYIDDLKHQLTSLGLEVVTEPVEVRRWTPSSWALSIDGSSVRVGSYVPYSGQTGQHGVTGPLSGTPGPGVVGVVHVSPPALRNADFAGLDWDAPHHPLVGPDLDLDAPFERVWLAQDAMKEHLAAFEAAGAAGLVIVLDAEAVEVDSSYVLYDGILRDLPALIVDRHVGATLDLDADLSATLVLTADVDAVTSRNLHVVIPGASEELVLLQSHTDGTNGLEDNGPEALLAMARYLVSVDQADLPRGIAIVLSTGHFTHATAWGLADFLRLHRNDLVEKTVAALSIEHLGAKAWTAHENGYDVSDAYELGCFFASPHRAMIDIVRSALDQAAVTDSLVVQPFTQDETGESPDGLGWPGDGTVLWNIAALPSANFISGPGYLLTELDTTDLVDVDAVRRQAIAFLDAAFALSVVPRSILSQRLR